jgi:hypothetical protein
MRLINDTIEIMEGDARQPSAVCWRGGMYVIVHVLDSWTWRSTWWGREEQRDYMLIETSNGVMEVYRTDTRWMLSRMFD